MTSDQFRKILDRFHEHLTAADTWASEADRKAGYTLGEIPWCTELHGVWCDLNRECALMKDAERRTAASETAT